MLDELLLLEEEVLGAPPVPLEEELDAPPDPLLDEALDAPPDPLLDEADEAPEVVPESADPVSLVLPQEAERSTNKSRENVCILRMAATLTSPSHRCPCQSAPRVKHG